jgi:hypothetical protein
VAGEESGHAGSQRAPAGQDFVAAKLQRYGERFEEIAVKFCESTGLQISYNLEEK